MGFALILASLAAFSKAQAFDMYFDPTYTGDVWIQVQDPNFGTSGSFAATYTGTDSQTHSINFTSGTSQVLLSDPVKLSSISSGGLNISNSNGAVFFVFYDDPTGQSRTAPQNQNVSTLRFQTFEMTMTGHAGDQGNLTAINYFTAPLTINSYENDPHTNPSQTPLQTTGFNVPSATISTQLAAASGGNSAATVTNGSGDVIRYLGPSNVFATNPYPSFVPYAQSAQGQDTLIQRTNGFNFSGSFNTPVYQFGANMIATTGSDGTITLSGSITATTSGTIRGSNPALPLNNAWGGATIVISATDTTAFNNAIYGQTTNSAVTFSGTAWSAFQTFTSDTLMDPSKAHQGNPQLPNYNPSLSDIGAFETTQNMIIGEITTAFLGGFVNSDYVPPFVDGLPNIKAIKDLPSNSWWSLTGNPAYSEIQPTNTYYNPYADVIYNDSGNTVYGVPYSDRFGTGPLVDSVVHDGTDVNYWVVGIGAPIPEPSTYALSAFGLIAITAAAIKRKKTVA